MKSIQKDLLGIKNWIFFLLIVVFYILIGFFIRHSFYSESTAYNTYADQLTYDRIKVLVDNQNRFQWIGYLLVPVILFLKVLYNTCAVTTGSLLHNDKGSFNAIFNVCLKAEYVFVLMLIVKFAALLFVKEVNTLDDLNFIPGSLINLFDVKTLPQWAVYPLQLVNIWELAFCFAGTLLYATEFKITTSKAALLFCVPYLIGLCIWVLVMIFITLQFG